MYWQHVHSCLALHFSKVVNVITFLPQLNPFTTSGHLQILLCLTPDDFTPQRETPGSERVNFVAWKWFSYRCSRTYLLLNLHYLQLYFAKWWNWFLTQFGTESRGKNLWSKNHARSETVQRFSPTPFARDSLVLRTLHDLPRNKQALSSLKYHIFTKILFTDLLQSRSSSLLK